MLIHLIHFHDDHEGTRTKKQKRKLPRESAFALPRIYITDYSPLQIDYQSPKIYTSKTYQRIADVYHHPVCCIRYQRYLTPTRQTTAARIAVKMTTTAGMRCQHAARLRHPAMRTPQWPETRFSEISRFCIR